MVEEYNVTFPISMNLVIFVDFAEHVCRITRVLNQSLGNVILLGVGGSGRQSATRLATYVNGVECFQIEVVKEYGLNEFREDIKTCLMKCGVEDKVEVFMLCDSQIVNEQFVEAVSNVLNSGDVPNLYKPEDNDAIALACLSLCKDLQLQPTKQNIFAAYLSRVKRNVHVVLAFSPVGEAIRNRVRMFPSLVNCCTIDWFQQWPREALASVAKQQLANVQQLSHFDECLEMFCTAHLGVSAISATYLQQHKRYVYVTPTSYLELLSNFHAILAHKQLSVGTMRNRYQVGIDKIQSAEVQIDDLKKDLEVKQPYLEKTNIEVSSLMEKICADKEAASTVQAECIKKETSAQAKADECAAISEDAQRDLDKALPALDAAIACLKKLKMDHVREVKSLISPPSGVRLTMEAVCIMFSILPVKKNDPDKVGKKIDDYWEAAKNTILTDPRKLLDNLFNYDRDNIPDKIITAIKPYIERDDFDPGAIKRASVACEAMCMWARAMYTYHQVCTEVEPKRKRLAATQAELQAVNEIVAEAKQTLDDVNTRIETLEREFAEAVDKKNVLEHETELCKDRLDRAGELVGGLANEKSRWAEQVVALSNDYANVLGDCVLAASMTSYGGPFTTQYRQQMEYEWCAKMDELRLEHSQKVTMSKVLGDPVKIQQWVIEQLPNDTLSIENAIIMDQTRRWPLLIDPQRQANRYIKNMGKSVAAGFETCKLSDPTFLRTLEMGIQFGKWILLEDVGTTLDPALEPILQQQKIKDGLGFLIKLGDKTITFSKSFKLFLTTTLPNPHYSPETSVKVTLLNFAITPDGLEDQMLGITVSKERRDLQEAKESLVVQNAMMSKQLQDIEDEILLRLASSTGNVLDDTVLIATISRSKSISMEIEIKKVETAKTEEQIDGAREGYRPVAARVSVLFFCIVELAALDPMYQFSLQWFRMLFEMAIDQAEKSDSVQERLVNLKTTFMRNLYSNVCRGLFERDKLMFSFAFTLRILQGQGAIDHVELNFLLCGPTGAASNSDPYPPAEWITGKTWAELLALHQLPAFNQLDLLSDISANCDEYQRVYESPHAEIETLPSRLRNITPFQKLCFLRALRFDSLCNAVMKFVELEQGTFFVEPPTFDIASSFNDSSSVTPLVFILSSGSDPVADVLAFCELMNKRVETISLGQGQGPKAKLLVDQATTTGGWVLLQNCHLAISWMPELEVILERLNPDVVNKSFRLWLTSMPSNSFPVQILQNAVKMTNEPPKGLRANLLRSYASVKDSLFEESEKPQVFKRLLFGFCFFHAIVQDRRKFGPIGWNVSYAFTNEDLLTCRRQLMTFVNSYDEVPYKVLTYLGAAINYGGRVTDDKDKRLISTIIKTYICAETVEQGSAYKFSDSGLYYTPECESTDEYIEYIRTLPLAPSPEVFCMDDNCNISCAVAEASNLISGIQLVSSSNAEEGQSSSREDIMNATATEIMDKTPAEFDLDVVEEKFPTMYNESMNTVLKQECVRYNRLLSIMHSSLPLFRKALKGMVVMSTELDALGVDMSQNCVPKMWEDKGFLSLKPLSSWIVDLLERVSFLTEWIKHGTPLVFWLSGLFFPQAFLTGALQNFARIYHVEIDRLEFNYQVVDHVVDIKEEIKTPPKDGVYVYGIFLEGGRWCREKHTLAASVPKELYCAMPLMHFLPCKDRSPPVGTYLCPIYKVLSRQGTLSTTGHSTNFVVFVDLPSSGPEDSWIKAGLAGFLALKF